MTALLAALDRHRRRRRARFAMVGGALGAVGVAAAVALAAPAPVASSHAVTLPDGWQRVPGNTVSALATVVHGGRLYVFARGLDNSIQINSFTRASGWGTPRSIGGMTDAALAATVCWDGMYLFHKGIDRRVYVTSSFDGADWARWMEVPGGGQTDAALSASCPAMGGHGLRVYMTGLDGHVYENTRSMIARPKQWTGWSGWHEVGDGRMTNASLGSMAADIGRWGGVVLLCKGLDNHSYWKTFRADGDTSSAGTWSAWREIGGTTDVALAGSADMIVAKGITDQAGYVQSYLPASDSWTGWRTLRVGTTNAAYAIVGYFGDSSSLALGYYLFEKGSDDNGIYFQRLPSSRSR